MTRRVAVEDLEPVSNDGMETIAVAIPYVARIKLEGTTSLLFHRWSVESVAEKAAAAKGSATKKTDDVDNYVWRDEQGRICLPGEYLRQSIVNPQKGSARFRQDPRSPRKSCVDLYTAGIQSMTELAPIIAHNGKVAKAWDFLDQRRVTVQRNGITRTRPGFRAGWTAFVELQVAVPEYISEANLHEALSQAGRLVGVGDFRPTYGRFMVAEFKIVL